MACIVIAYMVSVDWVRYFLYSYGLIVMACIFMAYIVMAYIVMAYTAVVDVATSACAMLPTYSSLNVECTYLSLSCDSHSRHGTTAAHQMADQD